MYYKIILKGFSEEDRFEAKDILVGWRYRKDAEAFQAMIKDGIDIGWEYDRGEFGKETFVINPLKSYTEMEDCLLAATGGRIEKGGIFRDYYEIIKVEE